MDDQTQNGELVEIENLKQKCEEYLNGWKRERADFLNYKKDEMERIGQLVKYANEELILKILPILDNLILATNHIEDIGLKQIVKQIEDFLKKEGIEPIDPPSHKASEGQEFFNPNLMESIEEVEVQGVESGRVVEVVQQGYTMHGKLIRPARVKISK